MEIDVSRACRTCLCESNDMYQIRESAMNHNDSNFDWKNLDLSIAEVIMACSVVNVSKPARNLFSKLIYIEIFNTFSTSR